MHYPRKVQGIIVVLVLSVVLAACGATSSLPSTSSPSAYLAESRTTVALLEFTHRNQEVQATVRMAALTNLSSKIEQQTTTLTGTLQAGHLALHSKVRNGQTMFTLEGTLHEKEVEGTLHNRSSIASLHLKFQHSTFVNFERAVAKLRAQAPVIQKRNQLLVATIIDLQIRISTLARDAAALGVDVESLKENLNTEVVDVASAKSDSQKTEMLLSKTPPAEHSSLCTSVNTVRSDAQNVGNDDQFIGGFISGLTTTERSVTAEVSEIHKSDALVRHLTDKYTGWSPIRIPPESLVADAVAVAVHSEDSAKTAMNTIVASVNVDERAVSSAVNKVITATGCGSTFAMPGPLVATAK